VTAVAADSRLCQLCRACEQQRSCSLQASGAKRCMPPKRPALSRFAELGEIRGRRHRRARWTFHSGQRQWHAPLSGACHCLSGEARGTVCGEVRSRVVPLDPRRVAGVVPNASRPCPDVLCMAESRRRRRRSTPRHLLCATVYSAGSPGQLPLEALRGTEGRK